MVEECWSVTDQLLDYGHKIYSEGQKVEVGIGVYQATQIKWGQRNEDVFEILS